MFLSLFNWKAVLHIRIWILAQVVYDQNVKYLFKKFHVFFFYLNERIQISKKSPNPFEEKIQFLKNMIFVFFVFWFQILTRSTDLKNWICIQSWSTILQVWEFNSDTT